MVNKCKVFIQSAISNYWILLYDLSYEKIYKWTETKNATFSYFHWFSLKLKATKCIITNMCITNINES